MAPRMIDNLRLKLARLIAPEGEELDRCPHDAEDRVSMARMGHPYDWHCGACGYREES